MIDAQVAIPWRPTPDRLAAFRRCHQYWIQHGFIVHLADSSFDQAATMLTDITGCKPTQAQRIVDLIALGTLRRAQEDQKPR